MKKLYIGIDYSLNSPSVSFLTDEGELLQTYFFTTKKKLIGQIHKNIVGFEYPEYVLEVERYLGVAEPIVQIIHKTINEYDVPYKILIEGYSYGSTSSRLFQIAENCSILKYLLYSKGLFFDVVPPTTVKKYATGKGTADKNRMYECFLERFKLDLFDLFKTKAKNVGSPISDISDSVWIGDYGRKLDGKN